MSVCAVPISQPDDLPVLVRCGLPTKTDHRRSQIPLPAAAIPVPDARRFFMFGQEPPVMHQRQAISMHGGFYSHGQELELPVLRTARSELGRYLLAY